MQATLRHGAAAVTLTSIDAPTIGGRVWYCHGAAMPYPGCGLTALAAYLAYRRAAAQWAASVATARRIHAGIELAARYGWH